MARRKKEDDISQIDSITEVIAYFFKKMFQALNSWKKTLRLALLLLVAVGAAIAGKWILQVLK